MKCHKCKTDNPDDSQFCKKCGTSLIDIPVTLTSPPPEKEGAPKTPALDFAPGQYFGKRYQIIEEIGRGGMGRVYKALDTKLKRTVALKFLPPELISDSEAKERFIREAQAAAALDHNNICTIYEVDEAEGRAFISMAYIKGQSLRERFKKGPLEVSKTLDIAIQVAEGLEEAHKKGIVHRDIKSANIMVTEKGQAKIMDFGLAKVTGASLITKEAKMMGTVAYMSPEQAQAKPLDRRTDIWSFGVVLYEMISGQIPFEGETEASILYSIVHEEPKPIKDRKPGIPDEFAKIINRSLKKKPESRYQSMAEVLKDLRRYQSSLKAEEVGIKDLKSFLRLSRRPYVAVPVALIILAVCIFAVWNFKRRAKIRWARNQLIPEIMRLAEEEDYLEAFKLAQEVEKVIPEDPLLAKIWPEISIKYYMGIEPLGADVFIKDLGAPDSEWVYLGKTSKELMRVPIPVSGWIPRIKIQQEGYETLDVAYRPDYRTLDKKGSLPPRMVRVPADRAKRVTYMNLWAYESLMFVQIGDFLIDKFEVTNREFKEFVESGGYEKPEFWKHPFRKEGKILSSEEAMALFHDSTGRPGPATWEFGNYPEGQEEFPVTGVSWYEAAAYAEYIGKRLPTIYHWEKVSSIRHSGSVIPGSNFGTSGLASVGSYQGALGCFGTYDTAGNAREWCSNATGEMRLTVGGAWNDPTYFFTEPEVRSPFDRDSGNGFRCMKLLTEESTSEELEQPLIRITPFDWSKEKPFSDEVFNTWLSFITYPKTPLNPRIELTDDSSSYWKMEKISFDAAYDNERMLAYLFLPKNAAPPFHVIVYWPGINAAYTASSQNGNFLLRGNVEYFVKDGRALLYPILKGTYERGGAQISDYEQLVDKMINNKDMTVKQMKDIMRSIDYLESRDDIDTERLAYCGVSWGAHMGTFPCSAEKRIKTGILISGMLYNHDIFSWAYRVKIPMLMINGRYDTTFPLENTVKPLFRALGTSEEHKRHAILDSDHYLLSFKSRKEVIKVSLEWLDRYLGPVKRTSQE